MANDGKTVIVIGATDETGPAFDKARKNLAALQADARRAVHQQQQLAFQLNDFFVQVASGGSPLTALIQQGSQLSGTFGGIGNATKAVLKLLTPARLLFGGVAGAIAGVGLAAYQGAQDLRELQDALTMSGNAAGLTVDRFDQLARQLSEQSNTLTQGAVRDAEMAVAALGNIGPENFGAATEAVARYAEATGMTAAEAAKHFAAMAGDAAKWAASENRSLNFITAAQYQHIKALQESGREVEAQGVVYDALNRRLRQLEDNLGPIDRLLASGAKLWGDFWTAAKGSLDPETTAEALDRVQKRLSELQSKTPFKTGPLSEAVVSIFGGEQYRQEREDATRAEQADMLKRQHRESENAFAQANRAGQQQAGIAARQRLDALLDQTKGAEALSKALKENARDFKAAADAGSPYTDAQQKAINDATRKKFAGPKGPKDDSLRTQLEGRLADIRAGMDEERDLFQNANKQLADAFAEGDISIDQFYDGKQSAQLEYLVKLQAGFRAEIDAWKAYKDKVKPQRERDAADNAIAKTIDAQAKAFRDLGQAAEDAEKKRVRASVEFQRTLADFDAQIKELSGDRYGAEQIRNAQRLEAARKALAPGGGDEKRLADLDAGLKRQAEVNRLQEQLALITEQQAVAEEGYLVTARARGAGLLEQERGIQAIRERSIEQLQALTEKARAFADASGDPRMTLWADQLQVALERARAQVDPTLERVKQATETFGDSIADAAESVLVDFQSLDDAFNNLGKTLHRLVTQTLVIDPLREALRNMSKDIAPTLSGFVKGGGGGGGGGGGPFGGLLGGVVGGWLGGGAQSTPWGFTGVGTPGEADATQSAREAFRKLELGASTTTDALSSMASQVTSATAPAALGQLALSAYAAAAALQAMAGSGGASALGSVGGSLFSFGSMAGSGFGTGAAFGNMDIGLFLHGGGVVGEARDFRAVPAGIFDHAMRMHRGGIARDEVPAILRRGEEVLTQADPRHRDNGGGRASKQINLSVNVSATPGMTKQTAAQQGAAAGRAARAALARND